MQIGTLTTGVGVVTSIQLSYLPQYLFFAAATQLTRLVATVAGLGVLCDIDATGITVEQQTPVIGKVTNGGLILLSNGLIKDKNVTLEFTNSAAQTPAIYAGSQAQGTVGLQTIRQTVLAQSGQDIKGFLYASFPNAGATDVFTLTYSDGTVQQMNRDELRAIIGQDQFISNTANDLTITNWDNRVVNVNFIPAAQQVIYVKRFAPISGASLNTRVSQ